MNHFTKWFTGAYCQSPSVCKTDAEELRILVQLIAEMTFVNDFPTFCLHTHSNDIGDHNSDSSPFFFYATIFFIKKETHNASKTARKSLQLHTADKLINWNNSLGKARWQIISRIIKVFLFLESIIPHSITYPREIIHKVESDVCKDVWCSAICNSKVIERTKWQLMGR